MTGTKNPLPGYEHLELLHSSSRTLVYRAVQLADNNTVIIKLLNCEYPTFSEILNFRNQYTIAKNLDIPGIVKPLTLEDYGHGLALVMEDFGGISLSDYVAKQPLSLEEFFRVAIALTQILEQLYRHRVIHKDIKPSNIIIHPQSQQIKLTDFSISSLLPRETQVLQNPNVLKGTLAYISPEQTGRMNRGIDYRSDFYSVGVTFYELLTGQLPFVRDDPMELVHCQIAKIPTPPHTLKNDIPQLISYLVMKLMAKTAEQRYQSALGLKSDLENCLRLWQQTGKIEPFELGKRDVSDRFLIPEKLYGRESEVQTLLEVFNRVANGSCEIVLVAGFSGIGKTAVINEVHKPIVRQRGYFIKGKFDQLQRNIPFSAFVQAFRDLMGQLLGESDTQLETWKSKILTALGEDGQVIIEVIPELERIIGKQPPAAELSGSAVQNRFNRLFQKFIQVFTTAEHPLVIFVDDLQWVDSASLKLMQLLMSNSQMGYLLLLGAYRDNEVFPAHPLMLTLDEIDKSGATLNTIILAPLSQGDLNRLVAGTLSCQLELALPLTELVHQKTKGNPFFATQFLKGLHEDGWIAFNLDLGYWQCDMTGVRQLALTDDVVEFMATRLYKLPEKTQRMLQLAACIGNQFDLATLAIVCEQSSVEVATGLWKALEEGLVLPVSDSYKFFQEINEKEQEESKDLWVSYKFLHDRVQQAAYSLIPETQKQTTHYRIGKRLLLHLSLEEQEERIFDIVNQINIGRTSIEDDLEKQQLVELNLKAGRKAIASTACEAANIYLQVGIDLLAETVWTTDYALAFKLHIALAEAQLMTVDFESLEKTIATLLNFANSPLDRAKIYVLKVNQYSLQGTYTEAIKAGLEGLQELKITVNRDTLAEAIREDSNAIEKTLKNRSIASLVDLPTATNPEAKAAIELLMNLLSTAYNIGDINLYSFTTLRNVRLSIEYGNIPKSVAGYINYGWFLGIAKKQYQRAAEFADLALQLSYRLNSKSQQSGACFLLGTGIHVWAKPIDGAAQINYEGFLAGMDSGELQYAGYNLFANILNRLVQGENLATLAIDIDKYWSIAEKIKNDLLLSMLGAYKFFIDKLSPTRDEQDSIRWLAKEQAWIESHKASQSYLPLSIYYILQMQEAFLSHNFERCIQYETEARKVWAAAEGSTGSIGFYCYGSLNYFALYFSLSDTEKPAAIEQIEANQIQLKMLSESCRENFEHKYFLVEAERSRVAGNRLEAIDLYDRAIAGAKENEYIQEEALANELAAKFYLDWGKEKFAALHMQEAYYCYSRWGAKAKVEDLEKRYPTILLPIIKRGKIGFKPTANLANLARVTIVKTTAKTEELLDLATLMKASHTLSKNIELEGAIANLMQVARENAGAETVALMLFQERVLMLTAKVTNEEISAINPVPVDTSNAVPLRLINRVKNNREPLVLENASEDPTFAVDAYIKNHRPLSILCLPLVNRGQLIGILYLENNQCTGAFTGDRLEILNLLCSQAAISLENARLYRESQNYARQLEQTQMQLVQSEKMAAVGQLTAGIAHEINNPVGFISGNLNYARSHARDLIKLLELYQKHYPKPVPEIAEQVEDIDLDYLIEDLPKLINSMKEGTQRITQISHSMRTFSRSDTVAKIPFNIHEGLESTLLILKHRLKANEKHPAIDVVKQYGDLPEIPCYPGQLNQVFMNLLANAIDALEDCNAELTFARSKGRQNRIEIVTELAADNRQALVRIRDNGTGIPEEIQVRIFEKLFTTKPVGKGTGIGLAISRDIIEQKHGGTLTCLSTVGKGTEFAIALPAVCQERVTSQQ